MMPHTGLPRDCGAFPARRYLAFTVRSGSGVDLPPAACHLPPGSRQRCGAWRHGAGASGGALAKWLAITRELAGPGAPRLAPDTRVQGSGARVRTASSS